jgi:hypothetical protein
MTGRNQVHEKLCFFEYQTMYKVQKPGNDFFVKGPEALRLIVQPCDEDDMFFPYYRVMEHRWNKTDRGKPKY